MRCASRKDGNAGAELEKKRQETDKGKAIGSNADVLRCALRGAVRPPTQYAKGSADTIEEAMM